MKKTKKLVRASRKPTTAFFVDFLAVRSQRGQNAASSRRRVLSSPAWGAANTCSAQCRTASTANSTSATVTALKWPERMPC